MSKIINFTQSAIKTFDFFPNRQFIRYEHQNDYKTVTGGAVSLAIIACFTILFLNNGLKTARKELITSSFYTQYDSNPTAVDINFKDKSFLFSIFIPGFNLTDPSITWFDITASQIQLENGFTLIKSTDIPLVPCTPEHLSITEGIAKDFQRYKNFGMLCPSLSSSLHLQGKISSKFYSYLQIKIKKCDTNLHNNCAPDSLIQQIQSVRNQFLAVVPIVTTVINPSNQEYKTYINEDRNYFYFTTTKYGVQAQGYYEGYSVDTDQSILPFESRSIENGGLVRQMFTQKKSENSTQYMWLSISKSPIQTNYIRSFQKLDFYLSYVGGLIGIVLILFFIFNIYTETAYSISLASKIFTYKQKQVQSERFNFFYFIMVNVVSFFKVLRRKCSSEIIDQFIDCKNEIEKQVDITFILKRIKYLQNAISVILQQHQFETLHLRKKEELQKAKYNRLLYQKQGETSQINTVVQTNKVMNPDIQEDEKPSNISSKPLYIKPQRLADQVVENGSESKFNKMPKTLKMIDQLQKLLKQARNGDPISCKVAKKIGVDLNEQNIKAKGNLVFDLRMQNYDPSENL